MINPIQEELQRVRGSIEKAKRNEVYTLLLEDEKNKKYVLSRYNPIQELKEKVSYMVKNRDTLWIIIGYGFGYILQEMLKVVGDKLNCIVIEPSGELLEKQFNYQQADTIGEWGNIKIFSGDDFIELKKIFQSKINISTVSNMELVVMNGYELFYPIYINKVMELITDERIGRYIAKNTLEMLGEDSIRNIIRNRYAIEKSSDIRVLKAMYQDIPAVVVSAGPSLDKNLMHIKDFKGIIFTIGRTLTPVMNMGVRPDFVVNLDPSHEIYETFMDYKQNDIPLIADIKSNYKVIEDNNGTQYFIDGKEGEAKSILNLEMERIETGGSVATVALSAAHYIGCNPIIFIGQDLAYTDDKSYSDTCNVEDHSMKNRFLKEIEGYNGDLVKARPDFMLFRDWIENFIKEHNEVIYINATEGGCKIQGTQQQPFKDIVDRYKDLERVSLTKGKPIKQDNMLIDEHIIEQLKKLEKVKEYANSGKQLSQELKEEYVLYKGKRKAIINQIFKNMEIEVDKKIEENNCNKMTTYMFVNMYSKIAMDPRYKEAINEDDIEKGIRIASLNEEIYTRFEELVECVINIIKNELEGVY